MTTSHFILVDEDLTATQVSDLCDELKDVDGITQVISLDSVTGPGFETEPAARQRDRDPAVRRVQAHPRQQLL